MQARVEIKNNAPPLVGTAWPAWRLTRREVGKRATTTYCGLTGTIRVTGKYCSASQEIAFGTREVHVA